jgi:hypothetical protein
MPQTKHRATVQLLCIKISRSYGTLKSTNQLHNNLHTSTPCSSASLETNPGICKYCIANGSRQMENKITR